MEALYSLENATKFGWASITGTLNPQRLGHLENYLVGTRILDAGCGGGAYVDHLTRQGLEVCGIDRYGQFLGVAKQGRRAGSFLQGDLLHLPFRAKVFDSAYCFDVLEHVDDRQAIRELARVTRQRLIVAVPREDDMMGKYGLTFFHYSDKTHLRNYTEESLRELACTLDCKSVTVLPEQPVQMTALLEDTLQNALPARIARWQMARKGWGAFAHRLACRAAYRRIDTGLVAIIEL